MVGIRHIAVSLDYMWGFVENICSNSVAFFYWLLELFRQCGIFLLVVGTVPTVWYFSIGCWNCSENMRVQSIDIILELSPQILKV
jgi:hypothetical protein